MDKELLEYLQGMESRLNERFDKIEYALDNSKMRLDAIRNRLERMEYKLRTIDEEVTDMVLNKTNIKSRYSLYADESILLQIQDIQEIQAIHTRQIAEIMRKLDYTMEDCELWMKKCLK